MFGIGKKTAWNAWDTFPEVTDTFVAINQPHTQLTAHEASGVLMYSKNCRSISVNEARKLMFTVGLRPLEFIPQTPACVVSTHKASIVHRSFHLDKSLYRTQQTFQTQVNGTGNGMTGPREGYHSGPVCQMPAKHAQCCSTVAARLLVREKSKCHQAGLRCGPVCKYEGGCTNSASD